jgi:hypothetical protein
VSALERRLSLSREAIEQIQSDYGPNAGDLEKVVFALRSELGKVYTVTREMMIVLLLFLQKQKLYNTHTSCISRGPGRRIHCGVEVTELSTNKQHTLKAHEQMRMHGIAADSVERSAVSGLRVSSVDGIAELAERVSDLRTNERELLKRQNDEYKSLVRQHKANQANQGSALKHWGAAAAEGIMSKGEILEMLKNATAKHAAAQEKLLRSEEEISNLQEVHWKLEEQKAIILKCQCPSILAE